MMFIVKLGRDGIGHLEPRAIGRHQLLQLVMCFYTHYYGYVIPSYYHYVHCYYTMFKINDLLMACFNEIDSVYQE